MLPLRLFVRLVEIALMAAIALLGLGVAAYCENRLVALHSKRPDRLLHLPRVRDRVGHFLAQTAAPGPTARLAAAAGAVAVLAGLLIIFTVLKPRRERLLLVDDNHHIGVLAARRRPIAQMLHAHTRTAAGITGARRVRVRIARNRRRGRVQILASRARGSDAETVARSLDEHVGPVADGFALRTEVQVRTRDSDRDGRA